MERVAFLIEETGVRIGCLLNPENLVARRQAGVRPRSTAGGLVTGNDLSDDPLLFSGGGHTEIVLNLLFDTGLAGSSPAFEDVRELTRPIWALAENSNRRGNRSQPPICRFIWGKSWNLPGIVTAVAERYEQFTINGVPRRSWLRLRFYRISDPPSAASSRGAATGFVGGKVAADNIKAREVTGGLTPDAGVRPDQLAYEQYGDAGLWRLLMAHNRIFDPLHIPMGTVLALPSRSELEAMGESGY